MQMAQQPTTTKPNLNQQWLSLGELEFTIVSESGRMSCYLGTPLLDLDIPQDAATILSKDNDGATATLLLLLLWPMLADQLLSRGISR
jgi:hypothetical protein